MSPEIKLIELKNGSKEAEMVIRTTFMSMQDLFKKDPIALYELNELAKNPDHKIFGDKKEVLENAGLLQMGVLHDVTRNIVLSSHEGEGLKTKFSSPVKQDIKP